MIILFILVIEILGLILLGKLFGILLSILWIIITFFIGIAIFKSCSKINISQAFSNPEFMGSTDYIFFMSMGGLGLMLPGLLSDIFGLGCVIYALFIRISNYFKNKNSPKIIDAEDWKER